MDSGRIKVIELMSILICRVKKRWTQLIPNIESHEDYQMYRRIKSVLDMLLGHTIGSVQWAVGCIGLEMWREF